ncbi:hypothetical protein D3C87_2009340 [compost metagenome]
MNKEDVVKVVDQIEEDVVECSTTLLHQTNEQDFGDVFYSVKEYIGDVNFDY